MVDGPGVSCFVDGDTDQPASRQVHVFKLRKAIGITVARCCTVPPSVRLDHCMMVMLGQTIATRASYSSGSSVLILHVRSKPYFQPTVSNRSEPADPPFSHCTNLSRPEAA